MSIGSRGVVVALLVFSASPAVAAEAPGIDWVNVPGGEFRMGSNEKPDEKPPHKVRVGDFAMARTELTQAQWRAVMGTEPSNFGGCDDCPVENVSWNDVQSFFATYLEKTGVALRLPTEAEWEYAAGGGGAHLPWAGTDASGALGEYAWTDQNSERKTHPVAQKKPNALGLHDMSGNVAEWVADWYDDAYYASSPPENPTGPETGDRRVARGGSWWFSYAGCRTSFRMRFPPSDTSWMVGFRPVKK